MNRALLVGINAYPGCPLAGCVNDVQHMAEFLVSAHGFQESDIRLLTDARATTGAILDRLAWLVGGVQAGDRILFHYSGHGATFAGRNAAGEVDGVDDVICPVDFDWSPERMIADFQFVRIFEAMPPGVLFNWISDSCHSGHLDRQMPAPVIRPRAFPVPADMAWRVRTARARGLAPRGIVGELLDVGFVSGCSSDQTSADTWIDGEAQGALTGYLLKQLKVLPSESPLKEIVAVTAAALNRDGYDQVPQADGARAGMPFLEGG